ncbi:isochorismatase family cysteine hydrolase [Ruminococcus sp.]|uniref:isochorismatase family cysteine hydrolase n=1 Tax=Ruminococcus sp. TaxID=41978 RepID=UPI0025F44A20|nr:isochorismatase family cysteine hydrolase [Ruminococcus sp.]MCR4638015.1 cysteine hydrolase [Ruminococcus sp.]
MSKKALLVIDMQNDYLWEKRKPMFSYDTPELVDNVNKAVRSYKEKGWDIIYISQIFPNIITNRWIIGFSIAGTEGAGLYSGLDIVSDLFFDKNLPDAFTSKKFREFFHSQGYDEVAVCGLDECGCVGATALGAVKAGLKTSLLKSSTGCRFKAEKAAKQYEKLTKNGVEYI